jgi:type VI secretion system secreted protein VgrG
MLMAIYAELTCSAPGADDLQLVSMTASEGLSRPFEIVVDLLCTKSNLSLPGFLGKSMSVTLEVSDGKRHFNGLVARFSQTGARTKEAIGYQAVLRPWWWFLSRTQDCKIFQNKTVVEIIEEVFNDHASLKKFKNKLSGTYTKWEYCVQYRESDMNFVSRLMEQEGIYYYFEHTSSGHEMVLCDGASCHAAFPGYSDIPYAGTWRGEHWEALRSWNSGVQVLPGKVVLADFDFTRPATQLSKSHAVTRSHDLASFEVFDYPGEYTVDGDGVAYAKVRAQEQQAGYMLMTGDADSRGVACGHTFNTTGLPNASENGEYLVVSTHIHVDELSASGEEGEEGHYACQFQVMPSSNVFRATRSTPKPMVHGPQTAMVVGPSGEHIHTDEHGRVKVQFHWDRLGERNESSSCWVRVSQPWAGKGFGMINIPRIGDEVVVSFLEGDPDQPLITGRVYNADFVPPYELPANASITGIFSRSVGDTDKAKANELRFEDKPGEEYIWLQAQKDFHREVENNDRDTVKVDQLITVGGKRQEDIGGTLEQTVTGAVKTTYEADHHHKVGGDFIAQAGTAINLKAGSDLAIEATSAGGLKVGQGLDVKAGMDFKSEAGMNMHIKAGMNVTIEAGMTLTLKAGAGTIVIGPGTITIDAPMVSINGGGGGGSASAASPGTPAAPEAAEKAEADSDPLAS